MIYPYIMVYGPPGGGKTWFCKAAAEHVGWNRTLWINTERPIISFEHHRWTAAEPWGVMSMQDTSIEAIIKELDKHRAKAMQGKWPYDLYVLDGITETEFVNMAGIEDEGALKNKMQMWGEQSDDLLRLFWVMRAGEREPTPQHMGAYSIITAGEIEVPHPILPTRKDGSPNMIHKPAIRGMWGKHGGRHFNMVLYLESGGMGRRVHLKPTGDVHVKNDLESAAGCPSSVAVAVGKNIFVDVLQRCRLLEGGESGTKPAAK